MKKTILIAGGASVASLAVGAASGYLIAKKRFEAGLGEVIDKETAAIKKHYSIMLMEARQKPESPADILRRDDVEEPEELSEQDHNAVEKARMTAVQERARQALTDYQGISTKAVAEANTGSVTENVFDTAKKKAKKKALPPRDPASGAFRKRTPREEQHEPPELIDAEAFLLNEPEHEQETLLYFINDKALVQESDPAEQVDINFAGEVNLTLFPNEEPSIIFVRNTALSIDYEIKKMEESLTDYLGLGENDGTDDEDSAKYL